MSRPWLRIAVFTTLSYTTALVLDVAVLTTALPMTLWGLTRMWCVALSVLACMVIFREDAATMLKRAIGLSKRAFTYYLLAPLLVYSALTFYVTLSSPLGFFKLDAYVNTLANAIRLANPELSELQARYMALTSVIVQLPLAYIAAISVNTLATLGEEVGWRGYLYMLLGSRPSFRNTVIIGTLWGLWHASAIALLGYNYRVVRHAGIVLFTAFTTTLTYPHLLLVSKSSSVLPAASLHGAVNALWGLTVIASDLPTEFREVLLGLGVLGIVVWTLVDAVLYIVLKTVAKYGG